MAGKLPADQVLAWRTRYGLTQPDVDRLCGMSAKGKGRACRRWEETGAPEYVGVLFAHFDKYGLEFAEELAKQREASDG